MSTSPYFDTTLARTVIPELEDFKAAREAELAARDAQSFKPKKRLGDEVRFGKSLDLVGTIEEIIWSRGMSAPFYLVEYWHEGQLCRARIHEEDCR